MRVRSQSAHVAPNDTVPVTGPSVVAPASGGEKSSRTHGADADDATCPWMGHAPEMLQHTWKPSNRLLFSCKWVVTDTDVGVVAGVSGGDVTTDAGVMSQDCAAVPQHSETSTRPDTSLATTAFNVSDRCVEPSSRRNTSLLTLTTSVGSRVPMEICQTTDGGQNGQCWVQECGYECVSGV